MKVPNMDEKTSGVMFLSYSLLNSASRMDQLVAWLGNDFDGCLVFDECHKAKNAVAQTASSKISKTAVAVVSLQDKLPKACVVYASATGKHDTFANVFKHCLILFHNSIYYRCI